jgi:hypothetical protein
MYHKRMLRMMPLIWTLKLRFKLSLNLRASFTKYFYFQTLIKLHMIYIFSKKINHIKFDFD